MVRTVVSAVGYKRVLSIELFSLREKAKKKSSFERCLSYHRVGVIRQGVRPLRRLLELFAGEKRKGAVKVKAIVA